MRMEQCQEDPRCRQTPQRRAPPSSRSAPRTRSRLLVVPRPPRKHHHRSCRCLRGSSLHARIMQSNNSVARRSKLAGGKHPCNQRVILKCSHLEMGYLRKIPERCQLNCRNRVTVLSGGSGSPAQERRDRGGASVPSRCTKGRLKAERWANSEGGPDARRQ